MGGAMWDGGLVLCCPRSMHFEELRPVGQSGRRPPHPHMQAWSAECGSRPEQQGPSYQWRGEEEPHSDGQACQSCRAEAQEGQHAAWAFCGQTFSFKMIHRIPHDLRASCQVLKTGSLRCGQRWGIADLRLWDRVLVSLVSPYLIPFLFYSFLCLLCRG